MKRRLLAILVVFAMVLSACSFVGEEDQLPTRYGEGTVRDRVDVSESIDETDQTKPKEQTTGEQQETSINEGEEENTPVEPEKPEEPQAQYVSFYATGDIMFHGPQIRGAKRENGYDFSKNYEYMKPRMDSVDFVMANFETTCDQDDEVRDYPMFNAPIEAVENLKASGFDILSTMNNHSLDSGVQGIAKTLDSLHSKGLDTFGTYDDPKRPKLIRDFNGIKIAFLAYTESFNGLDMWIDDSNSYMVSPLDEDLIKKEIEEVKAAGADFVIIYPHWGDEYSPEPAERQVDLAHKMIDWGADAVLGSHPHVLERAEWVEKDGQKKFIIYSMGNSISNQRREFMDRSDGDTETGVFLKFTLEKKGDQTNIVEFYTVPTWVNRYQNEDGQWTYAVTAVEDYFNGNAEAMGIPAVDHDKIQEVRDRAYERLDIEPLRMEDGE